MYDIAIIGRGPAGISAALNASIRNKTIIIIGKDSSKILSSPIINNYPGLPEIKGQLLSENLYNHLTRTNAILSTKSITAIYSMGNSFTIQVENEMIEAKTVILSIGVDYKKSIENEDIFLGNGVSYCATCDAPLYKGKQVCVIGYNKESIEETRFLSELCAKVYFIPILEGEYEFSSNVEIIKDKPIKFQGVNHAQTLVLQNHNIEADGFFVLKETYPVGALVPGLAVDGSHVVVNRQMETNIKGLYAAGDVTGKPYQISKAIGEGQVAALAAVDFLNKNE
jgi:thioredoxin reductase (NADPH)